MDDDADAVLQALVRLVGSAANSDLQSALTDEHARWRLYREAVGLGDGRDLVLAALRLEEDATVASPTVVLALELTEPAQRQAWLDVLPPGAGRDFAERRAAELAMLERLAAGSDAMWSPEELDGWSQWLQQRLASTATTPDLLAVLAHHGVSRRVRGLARERLQRLAKAEPGSQHRRAGG